MSPLFTAHSGSIVRTVSLHLAPLHRGSAGSVSFIYSLLTKRLLSCPLAFARTWWRHLAGEEEDTTETQSLFDMARISAEKAEEQAKSDDERSTLEEDAARYSGSYFRSRSKTVEDYQRKVSDALNALGYSRKLVEDENKLVTLAEKSDSKTEALVTWITRNLFVSGKLRDDERLIVFTEYKETLFFLSNGCYKKASTKHAPPALRWHGPERVRGRQGEFEDKTAAVRLLLATDAASEGINMQEECRWVIHYDIPWSPSKIVQRNGRVSRHGQTRDVSVFYFHSNEDEDLEFLAYVASKVSTIQDDLGSVERVFDAAIQRHFQGKKIAQKQIDFAVEEQVKKSPSRTELGKSSATDIANLTERAKQLLESTDARLGISPDALVNIMRSAIAVEGQGALEEITGKPGFYRLKPPPRWEALARQTLTVGSRTDRMELVFDSASLKRTSRGIA